MDEKRAKFLASLEEGNSIAKAASDAGVGRTTAYEWRGAEPEFAKAWDDAVETGTDGLEDEAVRRAKAGSDTLLIFMLKARRPERYKERYLAEHRGTVQQKSFEQWLDELKGPGKEMIERALEQADDASHGNGAIMPNSRVSGG
jgi:transposase